MVEVLLQCLPNSRMLKREYGTEGTAFIAAEMTAGITTRQILSCRLSGDTSLNLGVLPTLIDKVRDRCVLLSPLVLQHTDDVTK